MAKVYLSLGSNLGNRTVNLDSALKRLDSGPVKVLRVSNLYETTPVGVTDDSPDFLNLAALVETDLPPQALLEYVQTIERGLGRTESYRWGPRVIDIDILLYQDVTVYSKDLQIPHPRLLERGFVLIPLLEVDSDVRLPDGRLVREAARYAEFEGQIVNLWSHDEQPIPKG